MAAFGGTAAARLQVQVLADTARAQRSLQQFNASLGRTGTQARSTTRHTDTLNRSTGRLGPTLATAAKAAIGLGAAYVGLTAAKQAVTATTDLAKSTLTLKKGFGLTVETASELGAVLKARGADATSTGMAFNTLSKQVVAAKRGTETSVKAFSEVGVSLKEIKTLSPDQLLFEISQGMQEAGRGADRMAASSTLFGRGWKTVVPVLREGSDSLQDQLDLANKYGAAFGGKSLNSIRDLIATERELKIAQLGLQVQFTEKIAPALIKIGLAIAGAIKWFEDLSPTIKKAAAAVGLFALAIWGAVTAQAAFDAAAAANPYILIGVAAVAAAILIIKNWDKIKKAFKDAVKFVKEHAELFAVALTVFGAPIIGLALLIWKHWGSIKEAFKDGIHWIKNAWNDLGDILVAPFAWAFGKISGFINDIIGVINTVLGPVGVHIGEVGGGGGGKPPKGITGPVGVGKKPKGNRTGGLAGMVPGSGSGDKVLMQAMVEPNEGVFVMNRSAMAGLAAVNKAMPRRAGGGPIGKVAGAIGGAAGDLVGKLPGTGNLPDWLKPGGQFVLDAVAKFIASKAKGLFGAGGGSFDVSKGNLVAIGRSLQNAGYLISEHPAFGGVTAGVHTDTSYHYQGRAIDINWPNASQEPTYLNPLYDMLAKRHPLELFYQNRGIPGPVSGHWDHEHLAMKKGGMVSPSKVFGSSYGKNELATLAAYVGMGNPGLMAAIAMAESKGSPRATGSAGERGLWQIMALWGGGDKLYDPLYNAQKAKYILGKQGLSAWTTYTSGAYKRYLGGRVDAGKLARLRGTGSATGKGAAKVPSAATQALGGGTDWTNYNTRANALNELIGQRNLKALQGYNVGMAQNPILGIPSPAPPSLTAPVPVMIVVEDGAVDAKKIRQVSGWAAEQKLKKASKKARRGLPSAKSRMGV